MRWLLLILFVFLLCIDGLLSDVIANRTTLSSKRDGIGGIKVQDRFYFAGGFEFNDYIPTNVVDIYNITSGEWEQPIYLDEARGFISTAVVGQNIYFIGGSRYLSCALLYSAVNHQYESIGCGPTVRTPKQVSNHNSTVTVLGDFSADFFNISSNTWYYLPTLTSWMQSISGGIKLVHENLIIGIGGVNTTTLEQLNDAWIYDTETNKMLTFINVTSANLRSTTFSFRVAHGRLVIFTADRFFIHQFGTDDWRQTLMPSIIEAVILSDVLFVFNPSGYFTFSWSNDVLTWTDWSQDEKGKRILIFKNQVVLCQVGLLRIYEQGQWTDQPITGGVLQAAPWDDDKYVLISTTDSIIIYYSLGKSFANTQFTLTGITSIVAVGQKIAFFLDGGQARIYNYESNTLAASQAVYMIGRFAIGSDIIDLTSNRVWINFVDIVPVGLPSGTYQALSSSYMVLYPTASARDYFYMDVYNYVTREWMPKVAINTSLSAGLFFAPVIGFNDTLIITRRYQIIRYNTTSGETAIEAVVDTSQRLPAFAMVNSVSLVDGIGYLPGYVPSTLITVTPAKTTFEDLFSVTDLTTQFVASRDNVIYITTGLRTFEVIYTYDIAKRSLNTLLLPAAQSRIAIAISNNILVALGSDGNVYALPLDDLSTWYVSPLPYDFLPTIVESLDNGTIMVVGGRHFSRGFFTDEVLFINASAIAETGTAIIEITVPATDTAAPLVSIDQPEDEGLAMEILIVVIVVPIAVVLGGLIAMTVLLLKRRKQKKTSTLGLESRYGTWFTPFDQITFGEQLGQGGSGQVFKGKWKNTSVALKVSMTQANNSVITELELMMQLRPHPNVVQLFGFSVHPETNSIILIIELCEGGSLDTKLYDNSDEISLHTQVQWLTGIAKGLSHLHSNNIVHRDVAARNVLLNRNEPKLTDFGMSRLVDEQKQHGTTKSELGPIRWMSPESLKNKEYSTKSGKIAVGSLTRVSQLTSFADIWSFGILMFEVIARQEPHNEADPIEVGRLIRDEGLTPVIPSSCHPQLADLMKQCWQMSPQSRPKIEAIIESLESTQIN